MSLGIPRVHYRLTESTNERARALAAAGAPHGTLVTAREQSAGRGRQGRTWSAPAGQALLGSLVLREPRGALPLAAAVAVAEVCGPDAKIKWPNDVLIDGRKLAGILVEARPQERWAVLGIGLNVAVDVHALPGELRERAASLGRSPDEIEEALRQLLDALERWLAATDADLLKAWRARDALSGKQIEWNDGAGVAAGIDEHGSLLVDTANGRVALGAGEVHLASNVADQPL